MRDEQLKDAAAPKTPHRVETSVPVIEVTDHGNAQCIGRPDGEIRSVDAVQSHRMSSELLVDGIVNAGVKFAAILLGNLRPETVRVLAGAFSAGIEEAEAVSALRCQTCEKSALVHALHLDFFGFPGLAQQKNRPLRIGIERGIEHAALCLVRTEHLMGIIMLRIHDCLNLRPSHQLVQRLIHTCFSSVSVSFVPSHLALIRVFTPDTTRRWRYRLPRASAYISSKSSP